MIEAEMRTRDGRRRVKWAGLCYTESVEHENVQSYDYC
jgi:hypothetical protein